MTDKVNAFTNNQQSFQSTFLTYLDDYMNSTNNPDSALGSAYALKMTFGSAINLYMAPAGQNPPNFKAVTASNANNNPITSEVNCPK